MKLPRLLRLVVPLFTLIVTAARLSAAPVVTGNDPGAAYTDVNTISTTTGLFDIGQSFAATKTGLLTTLTLYASFPSGTATLKIYSGDGTGGTLLETQSLAPFNASGTLDTGGNRYIGTPITLTSAVSITNGSTYTFQITTTDFLSLTYTNATTYAGGTLYQDGADQGSSYDIMFIVTQADAGPTVTDANISVSGASGTGGAFKIGDTVTATWNNTAGGDNNANPISGVTVDFSQFGGGSAVAASNSSGTWTATYTIVAGAIDGTNRNVSVTATDTNGSTTTADTTNLTVDNVAPAVTDAKISISGASGTGGAYKIGDTVTATWNNTAGGDNNTDTISGVTVDFSQFGGGAAVAASNSSGTWTATYTIVSGAISTTNRNVSVTATDNAGNTKTTADTTNATVDNVAPTVASVSVPTNSTYGSGQNLDFTVNFSENVTATGTPLLALTIGSTGQSASYLSGSGTSALVFRYTVQTGDLDTDGITVGALTLNGGTLTDAAGNAATLTLNSVGSTASVLVDAVAPTVSSATVPSGATYISGQNLDFTVTYSENVTVNTGGGTPYVGLTLDTGGSVQAAYVSGSGTTTLTFRYTIASGNLDANGITAASSITLNGGTIRDSTGNNAQTSTLGFGSTTTVLVEGVAPTISSINRFSATPTNSTSISYAVTFSEAVSGVDTSDFTLTATGTATGSIVSVFTVNSTIVIVTVDTISGDGTLRLDLKSSGTGITDTPGNAIASGFTSGQTYTIDNTAPAVTSVSVPSNATYNAGQDLDFTVNFDSSVTVDTTGGTPSIGLTIGATSRSASYVSGSGTSALIFRYTVQAGDLDADGVAVGALALNSGTIKDSAGNNATLTLNSVGSTTSVLVDTVGATISSSTVPANATYIPGQNLDFTITYSENVTVNTGGGTPYVGLTLDTGGSVQAAYVSGSGTATLTFRYTIASGNLDSNGITAASSITLNGGTIKDAASNNATTGSIGFGTTAAVLVDGVVPTVSSINRQTPSGATTNATSVTYRVTFSEGVTGVDTADFSLTATGTATGSIASVSSVSGSVYDVTVNTISGDGTLRLDLQASGTGITDTPGNAIAAGFTSGQTYTIDSTTPTVASLVRQTPATVNTAATSITWRLTFSETVTGVDANDFTLTVVSGTASGTVGTVMPVSGSVYDIAVSSVAGIGALRLDVKASGTGIADSSTNAISGGFTTGDVYLVGATSVFDTVSLAAGTTRSVSGATTNKVAQRFTTAASAPLGLASVTAALGAVTGTPTPVVTLNADNAGAPGTVVATLTNPSSLTANALNTWSNSTLLTASTTYWIVFSDTSVAGSYLVKETAATTGGSGTWLTNADYVYLYGVNAATGPQSGALQIALGAATAVPTVTSTLTTSATYGSAISTYTITATGTPTSFGATGLPTGLTLNTSTGAITGTPTQTGAFNVSLTATNTGGTSAPATLVLTVAKAALTVTANSTSRNTGITNPTFTVSYSGFVNGDTATSLTTAPTATTTATINSSAGTYPITASGGVSNNYTFTYVDGILTVTTPPPSGGGGGGGGGIFIPPPPPTPTPVTIALSSLTATYDGAAKSVTATTTPSGAPVTITYNGSATAPTNAGSYTVSATVNTSTQTGTATGTLVISQAAQTITFGALTDRETTAAPFTISASVSSGLTVAFAVSGPASLSGNTVTLNGTPGTVTITASQAGNANILAAANVVRSFTVAANGPRVFIGDVFSTSGNTKAGDLGAVLPPEGNEGSLVIIAPSFDIDLAFNFTLSPDGTFVQVITIDDSGITSSTPGVPAMAAAPRTLTFRGRLANGVFSGGCDEPGLTFSIRVQPTGSTSNLAGLYRGSTINNSGGSISIVVGNNGEAIVLARNGATVAGGRTTLGANGAFTLTSGATTVRGTIDATTTSINGAITRAGAPDVSFSGVATTTVRTDRLINLSSRSRVGPTADRTLITGFVIGGTQSKRVLLRAVGPTLAGLGVQGVLSNPRLQVYDNTGRMVLENDDWSGTDTAATFTQTGAFTLPAGARDAALVTTLAPGAYTVHVTGTGDTGTALAEIYDASNSPASEPQRLVNISSRGMVEAGDGLLIGGFVVTGNTPKRILVRGVGPTLATLGVTGALIDPKLTLFSDQTKIAENDNWGTPVATSTGQVVASAADLTAAAQASGAFTFANGTKDAAVIVTLAPGAYTAQVSSVTGTAGVALVEVYEMP